MPIDMSALKEPSPITWRKMPVDQGGAPCFECMIADQLVAWIEPRPLYCDRGHWYVKCELPDIGGADAFPRYYMSFIAAKAEIEAFLRWRLWKQRTYRYAPESGTEYGYREFRMMAPACEPPSEAAAVKADNIYEITLADLEKLGESDILMHGNVTYPGAGGGDGGLALHIETQKQIAAVFFNTLANGNPITPEQEKELAAWIRGRAHFERWKAADIDETEFGGESE